MWKEIWKGIDKQDNVGTIMVNLISILENKLNGFTISHNPHVLDFFVYILKYSCLLIFYFKKIFFNKVVLRKKGNASSAIIYSGETTSKKSLFCLNAVSKGSDKLGGVHKN